MKVSVDILPLGSEFSDPTDPDPDPEHCRKYDILLTDLNYCFSKYLIDLPAMINKFRY